MTAAYLCSDFSLRAPPTAPFAPHASSPFVEHRRPLFIHIYLFLSRLFSGEDFFSSKKLEHRDQAFEFPKFRFHFQPITPPRPSVSPRVIFSRFPPTPTYLPVPRGSCNERQRADRQIRKPDTAGSERWRFIDSRKFTRPFLLISSFYSDTHLFHPSLPRDPSSWLHGPLSALSTWRNGKEAVDVATPELTLMEGEIHCTAESTLVSQRGVITGDTRESQQNGLLARYPGKEREVGFYERAREYPWVQHRVPLNASDLPPRRNFSFQRDNRGMGIEGGFTRSLYDACESGIYRVHEEGFFFAMRKK